MVDNRILSNPRELNKSEFVQLEQAKSKWYPKIIQTYNTTLFEMMASPYKKALLVGIILTILFCIFAAVDYNMNLNMLFNNKKINNLSMVIFVIVVIFFMGSVAIGQYKLNDELLLFLTLTKPNATKYDYETSTVIQSKLLRNSIGSGGYSSDGSSLMGGILGGAIGSSMGGRRSSRGRMRR